MTFFARLFKSRRDRNMVSVFERQRLSRTMPGQTGAMAGSRLGILV